MTRSSGWPVIHGRSSNSLSAWLLLIASFLATAVTGSDTRAKVAAAAPQQAAPYADDLTRPLYFEPNRGQADPSAAFVSRGSAGVHLFAADGVDLILPIAATVVAKSGGILAQGATTATTSVRLVFVGASAGVTLTGEAELPTRVNYFLGNEPSGWLTDVPTYSSLLYSNLHPGVDLHYDRTRGALKGTYTLAAGVSPSAIRWRYDGATNVEINATGDIEVSLANTSANLVEHAPVAWQAFGEDTRAVEISYALRADDSIGFTVGDYDATLPLVIDPTIAYSTFFGGGGLDNGDSIALDGNDAFVVGTAEPSYGNLQMYVNR